MDLQVFADGGSKGNPGEAAIGFMVLTNGKVLKKEAERIGVKTNNEAEYIAVIKALEWIRDNLENVKRIEFFLDSRLVVNQLKGIFKVKKAKFREFIFKIRALELQIKGKVVYKLVPRSENKQADWLVNSVF